MPGLVNLDKARSRLTAGRAVSGVKDATLKAGAGVQKPSLSRYSNANPLIIGHRGGGGLMYPEYTAEGYAQAYADGLRVFEIDFYSLTDTALGVIHDSTFPRTTITTGNVADANTATFKAALIDAYSWHGTYSDTLVPMLLPEVLTAYAGNVIFVPEPKGGASVANCVSALQARSIPTDQALIQSFALTGLGSAMAAGYPVMKLWTSGDTPASVLAAGVTYMGLADTQSDAVISEYVASGLKVIIYTVNTRYNLARFLALGVVGVFSDDPLYIARSTPFRNSDNFASKLWLPGMHSWFSGDDYLLTNARRGRFDGTDELRFSDLSATWERQGYLGPQNKTSFSFEYQSKFGTGSGTTSAAQVFLGDVSMSDRPFTNTASESYPCGAMFYRRGNGTVNVYQIVPGVGGANFTTTTLLTRTGTAVEANVPLRTKISAVPSGGNTSVTIEWFNSAGALVDTATVTYTGTLTWGHTWIGKGSIDLSFRGLLAA